MLSKKTIIERGKRLQGLRKKVGLTRAAFAEQTGMSANTLKALELGDRELTPQKALLFSNLFSGLFSVSLGEDAHEASFEYLYYGRKDDNFRSKGLITQDTDDNLMQSEISLLSSNSTYLLLKIQDQLMSPYYNEGDVVAGKKTSNANHMHHYQGQICLIEDVNGNILLRRVIKCNKKRITTCTLNTSVGQSTNFVEEFEVRFIAQAIWHWHLSQMVQNTETDE